MPEGFPCDDEDARTVNDVCTSQSCEGTRIVREPAAALSPPARAAAASSRCRRQLALPHAPHTLRVAGDHLLFLSESGVSVVDPLCPPQ